MNNLGFEKSKSVKNKLLTKFINKKGPILKEETHIEYKSYRDWLSTLMKNKQAYCYKYFETNWNNSKNTWNRIKSLISFKTVSSSAPTVLSFHNGNNITNPYDFGDTCNNYFPCRCETPKNNKIFASTC